MDDDDLVARVAAGDDTALRELFGRHAPWLAVRLRAVLPAADVEDVLQETFLAAWVGAGGRDPAEIALARADLEVAVAALGPDGSPEREVWRLMYEQDRPVAEVAELLGVPPGTVKSRAHRARRLLRAALRVAEGGTR